MKQSFKLPTLMAWGFWLFFAPNAKAQGDNLVLAFDGNGDYISFSPLPASFSNNPAFTMEAWFFANNPGGPCLGDFRPLLALLDPASQHSIEIGICNGGQLHYWAFNGGFPLPPIPLSSTDYSGACHHLAVTRNGSQIEVYVDGTSIFGGNVLGTNPFSFNTFQVGRGLGVVAGQDWEGQVDEIRLWDKVRSAQEIKDFKDCSLSGTSSGLVANWPLDQGLMPGGPNASNTQALDVSGNLNHGNLIGFNLDNTSPPAPINGNLVSNFVLNPCQPRYLLHISDQIALFPVSLFSICEGDYVHFCVSENFTAPLIVPSGTTVEWQSSDAGGPWVTDLDMLGYPLSTNATCFPVKKGVITNPTCGTIGTGYLDRRYRAKITKQMGLEKCTYTTTEELLRICCKPTGGTITIVPNIPGPWCEGDNINTFVFLNPSDPWLPFGPNVIVDWCQIDENGTTPLPQFQNQLAFGGLQIIVGTQDICLQAKIYNCNCAPITVELCIPVDHNPVCGLIDVVAVPPKPISPTPPAGFPYKYEICPDDYSELEMVAPATAFQNCNPVWQYHFGPPAPSPTSPGWVDLGGSNTNQNGSSSLLVVPIFERLCTGRLVTIGTECCSAKGSHHQK